MIFTAAIAFTGFSVGVLVAFCRKKKKNNILFLESLTPSGFLCRNKRCQTFGNCSNREKCSVTFSQYIEEIVTTAESNVRVCCCLFNYPEISTALIKLQDKGILVQMIVDDCLGDTALDTKKIYAAFKNSGVELRRASQSGLMHHKFVIIDEKTLILTSLNWTRNGFFGNYENLEITNEPVAVESFSAEFDYLWSSIIS